MPEHIRFDLCDLLLLCQALRSKDSRQSQLVHWEVLASPLSHFAFGIAHPDDHWDLHNVLGVLILVEPFSQSRDLHSAVGLQVAYPLQPRGSVDVVSISFPHRLLIRVKMSLWLVLLCFLVPILSCPSEPIPICEHEVTFCRFACLQNRPA